MVSKAEIRTACALVRDLCNDRLTEEEFEGAVEILFPSKKLFTLYGNRTERKEKINEYEIRTV